MPEPAPIDPVTPFEQQIVVRWQDIDANRHLRNTAYSEFATDTRFRFVAAHGYTQERFEELRFGPVILREDIRYRREVLLGQTVTVNVLAAGLSPDGSAWRVRHEIRLPDGREAATLTLDGGWLHLDTRRLVEPPADLLASLRGLPRTPDFEELPSRVRI